MPSIAAQKITAHDPGMAGISGPQHKALAVWQFIFQNLQQSIPVMLLYVLESNGSSPGRQGFSMAVNAAGEMTGSIGGGIMEHKFVEMVKEKLQSGIEDKAVIRKQVHDKTAAKDQSGMICSGDQMILLYAVSSSDIKPVEKIMDCLMRHANATLSLSPAGIQFSDIIPPYNFSFSRKSAKDWLYIEKLGYKQQLYIIGGGHCSLALSKLMSDMDFYIYLFDDRSELNTMQRNNYVHEKIWVDDYSQLKELIATGENHYVVVMSFGYRTDDIAIRALLGKSFGYFGVLGSGKKMEKLFSDYIAEGISEQFIRSIYAPVGVAINSRTPEEIAVSIAAEIIKIKNKN